MTYSVGINVGAGVVKTALFQVDGDKTDWLVKRTKRIRRRDPYKLAEDSMNNVIEEAGLALSDMDYIATTGEGGSLEFNTGHFYSITTHARGAIYLDPDVGSVLDAGALHGRAIQIDKRGKVLEYRMTSQCASGSGQFLENIARYLGITTEEIGALRGKRMIRKWSAPYAPCSPKPTSSTWCRAAFRRRIS
jgi:benzoyl-CoA reductase subunit D